MKADRFAELTVRGLYLGLPELWVSPQPFLLMALVCQLSPPLCRTLGQVAGKARLAALKDGVNVFDVQVHSSAPFALSALH